MSVYYNRSANHEDLTYIDAFLFIVITFTTVGYGNGDMNSDPKYYFVIGLEYYGLFFYSLIIGYSMGKLKSLAQFEEELSADLEDIKDWTYKKE